MANVDQDNQPVVTLKRSSHGTRSGYVAGCRCTGCRDADRVYKRRYAAAKKGKPPESWGEYVTRIRSPHGTLNSYQKYACRCRDCKDANNRHQALCRERRQENLSQPSAYCGRCQRWFTTHGLKAHDAAYHGPPPS